MESSSLSAAERSALAGLSADLGRVFGPRLHAVAAYGLHAPAASPRIVHTIALVEHLAFADLTQCAPLVPSWRRGSLAVPLILQRREVLRTLHLLPLEDGDIIPHHQIVAGHELFAGLRVAARDVARA